MQENSNALPAILGIFVKFRKVLGQNCQVMVSGRPYATHPTIRDGTKMTILTKSAFFASGLLLLTVAADAQQSSGPRFGGPNAVENQVETDSGETWKAIDAGNPAGTMLTDVDFFSETHGWVVGDDGFLAKTVDGGRTWTNTNFINEYTGFTDVVMDPRNSQVLYAASYQRRRQVWSLLAGGPGSAIHKSTDGGATWREIERGLGAGNARKGSAPTQTEEERTP